MSFINPLIRLQPWMAKAQQMREEEKLFRYKGVLYPTVLCPLENLKAMEDLEAREDDIMLATYPKCGSHWMFWVLKEISHASTGERFETIDSKPIEFINPNRHQLLSRAPSPRLLATHMHPDNIPPSFISKKTKMLVIFRNPKDTVVSFYHFFIKNPVYPTPESWDKFYAKFMSGDLPWGSYFDRALAWEKRIDDPNVMIVTYENMKTDLFKVVQQICQFFKFDLSEEQVRAIVQESTFDAMKNSSKEFHGQLANILFRKGEVGDWKNHFSEAQSEAMDAEFEKHLAGTKIGARMKYELFCK